MNPFREIWFNTDKCIDHCLAPGNRKKYFLHLVWIPAAVNGLRSFLDVDSQLLTEGDSLLWVLLAVLKVMITVIIFGLVLPWLLLQIGKLINGKGTFRELQLIVALSCIPGLINLIYLFLVIIIPGRQPIDHPLIDFLVWLFTIRVLILGVAKVQRVSYLFAFMNIFIPYFVGSAIYIILTFHNYTGNS